MRQVTSFALLLIAMFIPVITATAQPFSGTYSGAIASTTATLTLQQQGAALHGTIDAQGYGYTISGTTTNGGASCTLSDSQTGARLPCEIALQGATLTLNLLVQNSQQVQRVSFSFSRIETGPTLPMAQTFPTPTPQSHSVLPEGQRDPALFGQWVNSDTYISGEFSGTTRTYVQLNPDGTVLYGGGSVTAGVGGVSGGSSGGDVTQGLWRTENNLLYARGAHTAWTLIGRYYVEGNRVLITDANGEREVWRR